eukprot:Filipodium_phascolosomae@DN5786_c0_g1_i1.p1
MFSKILSKASLPITGCRRSWSAFNAVRNFSADHWEGKNMTSEELVKQADDWAVEETNFCLGRTSNRIWYREEDDLARRTQLILDAQTNTMHTRLRDGTCIPVMSLLLTDMIDLPTPKEIWLEHPLLKFSWDETYDDAWESDSEDEAEYLNQNTAENKTTASQTATA